MLVAAFACDAELMLLDEPTSGLDPLMEQVFQSCVLEAKQAGKTVFLSSHILSEVESLCDRIGIIKQWTIVFSGKLADMRRFTRMAVQTAVPVTDLQCLTGVTNAALKLERDEMDSLRLRSLYHTDRSAPGFPAHRSDFSCRWIAGIGAVGV